MFHLKRKSNYKSIKRIHLKYNYFFVISPPKIKNIKNKNQTLLIYERKERDRIEVEIDLYLDKP